MKKRGFGAGRWNGFGGKVRERETIEEAAHRELKEEVGLEGDLIYRGVMYFHTINDPEVIEVHLFLIENHTGNPVESDEMKPQWFKHDEIPFEHMWPDDKYWLPHFLNGHDITARFCFEDINTLLSHDIEVNEKAVL